MNTWLAVQNRIIMLCEEKKLNINQLATVSGVSASTVKSIIYGKSQNPGIVTIKMLCDGFDISLAEFFDTPVFKALEQEIR